MTLIERIATAMSTDDEDQSERLEALYQQARSGRPQVAGRRVCLPVRLEPQDPDPRDAARLALAPARPLRW